MWNEGYKSERNLNVKTPAYRPRSRPRAEQAGECQINVKFESSESPLTPTLSPQRVCRNRKPRGKAVEFQSVRMRVF
jgi:hypothetical protein